MKFKKLSALILGAILTVGIAAGVGLSSEGQRVDAANETTVTMTTFTATSASMDEYISYSTSKGGGTSNPAINSGVIRLYQNSKGTGGGTITITAGDGAILSSVTIGSSMSTSIAYTIGNSTTKSTTQSLPKNGKITTNDIEDTSITYYCMGTTSSTRLYVNHLSVTYNVSTSSATLNSLSIDGNLTKTVYYSGESWDPTGLTVTGTYSDGNKDVTDDVEWTYNPATSSDLAIGEHSLSITASLDGKFDTITRNITISKAITYELIDNKDDLLLGSQVIIAAKDSEVAMSATQNDNNRGQTSIVKSGNSIANPSNDVQIFTLEKGITDGTYAFNTGSGYIYAASSDKNYLRTQTTNDANGSWNIEITSDGVATIKATGSYTRNWLRYNNSNSIFSCYSSGQADVSLYQYLKPVEKKTVTSLEVKTVPNKIIYSVGEDFDPEGMVVKATYSDGTTDENVTSKCTFNPKVIGENTNQITITYVYDEVPYTTTLDITLKAVKDVVSVASKPNIYVGDTVDAGQFELNVEYNDGTYGTVQADEVNIDTTTAGVKEATATYNGASNIKTITFEVEVYGLTSLSWTNRGEHVAFVGSTLGEAFNTAEWKFTAKYNDENKTQLTPSPVFGTGENDVHVSLYETGTPNEENNPLTNDYVFTQEDEGKHLVAFYKGVFSSNNHEIDIVEELNNINKEVTVEIEGKAITFNLGDDGEPPHKDGSTAKTTYSETADDYTLSITGGEKMYPNSFDAAGNGAIKLGTSSAAGGFSFTVPEGIIKVDIHAAKYKANDATLDINGVKYVLTKNSNDGAYDVIQIDTSTTKTITLEVTSGYRAMVNSIVFYTAGQTTTQTINYANKNLMAQAAVMEFVNFFNTTMTADGVCSVDGITDYNSDTFIAAWELVANKWNELFGENTTLSSDDLAHAKAMFVYADSHWESEELDTDPLQRAMRTYDKVTSNTNLSKFIEGRPRVEDNGTGIKALLDNNASTIAAIVILAVITGFAFLFVSKRKQRKIEL